MSATEVETLPWSKTDHLLQSDHPIDRVSMLASKFTNEVLAPKAGFWPYPAGELHLMTATVLWREPDMIFEWGTNVGNSARVFSWITRAFGISTKIQSIDLPSETEHPENVKDLRGLLVHDFPDVSLHVGDGVDVAVALYERFKPERPLFFVDGDHARETVLREVESIRKAAPTAPILLDDTHTWGEGQGPRAAMLEFLETYPGEYSLFENVATLPGMSLLAHNLTLDRVH